MKKAILILIIASMLIPEAAIASSTAAAVMIMNMNMSHARKRQIAKQQIKEQQFQQCLKYKGGNACYSKHNKKKG